MVVRKGIGLMLAAAVISLMFVASATSPVLSGFHSSGGPVSDSGTAKQDGSSRPSSPAGPDKCCSSPAPAKDGTCKAPSAKDTKGLSVLRGRVLDMKTGKTVPGALVSLRPIDAAVDGKKALDDQGNCKAPDDVPKPPLPPVPEPYLQTKTDANGEYAINIKPGNFVLNVEAKGYLPFIGEVGVPKGTKLTHDIALTPEPPKPVPDCKIDGMVADAATGKGICCANVLIISLPKDFPCSGDALREMVFRYTGVMPAAGGKERPGTGITPDEKERMRQRIAELMEGTDGKLTEEQRANLKERLAQMMDDAGGMLTEEQFAQIKERLAQMMNGGNQPLAGLQQGPSNDGTVPPLPDPKQGVPEQPPKEPLPPQPPFPLQPVEVICCGQAPLSFITDRGGHFDAKLFSGKVLVIALARGYAPQWAVLDLPAKTVTPLVLKLEKCSMEQPVPIEPVREPPVLPEKERPEAPPVPQ